VHLRFAIGVDRLRTEDSDLEVERGASLEHHEVRAVCSGGWNDDRVDA